MGVDPAYLAAAASLAGDAANAALTGSRNKKQYERSIAMWRLQNQYNDPSAQMERLKRAGLNPNLVYGQGTQVTAGPVPNAEIETPQVNLPRAVSSHFDTRMRVAQTDNLAAQNKVLVNQADLISAQAENVRATTPGRVVDSRLKGRLEDINADYRAQEHQRLIGQTRYIFEENDRRELLTAQSLKEGIERILNMKAARQESLQRFKNLVNNNVLQSMEIELRKQGVTSQDELWQRIAAKILGDLGLSTSDVNIDGK